MSRSAPCPYHGYRVTDQPLTDPEVDAHHLAEQWLDIVDYDKTGLTSRDDNAYAPCDRDAALIGNETPMILIEQETRVELSGERNRLAFSRVKADALTLHHHVAVGWGTNTEPRCLREVDCTRTPCSRFTVDNGRDDDLNVEGRQEIEPADASKHDQRTGI